YASARGSCLCLRSTKSLLRALPSSVQAGRLHSRLLESDAHADRCRAAPRRIPERLHVFLVGQVVDADKDRRVVNDFVLSAETPERVAADGRNRRGERAEVAVRALTDERSGEIDRRRATRPAELQEACVSRATERR